MHDEQIHALIGATRAAGAAAARRRGRWLARQLREDDTFADGARRLAARGASVEVATVDGTAHRGCLVAAGDASAGGVVSVDAGDLVVHVRGDRVASLRELPGPSADAGRAPAGGVGATDGARIVDLLADLAGRPDRVVLGLAGGGVRRGAVDVVARDVVVLDDGALVPTAQVVALVTGPGA